MLINKKAVKTYFHENKKNVSEEAIECIDRKVQVFLSRAVKAANNFKMVKAQDVSLFQIKMEI